MMHMHFPLYCLVNLFVIPTKYCTDGQLLSYPFNIVVSKASCVLPLSSSCMDCKLENSRDVKPRGVKESLDA